MIVIQLYVARCFKDVFWRNAAAVFISTVRHIKVWKTHNDNTVVAYQRRRAEFWWIKTLIGVMIGVAVQAALTDDRVMLSTTCTLPTQLQRSTKLKISHRFYWSVSLALQDFIFCRKHFEQGFCSILFTLSQLFNEMFIFNGKSRCCNNTFINALLTLLLAKNNQKTNYLHQHSLSYIVWNFHSHAKDFPRV